ATLVLAGYSGFDEMESVMSAITRDPGYRAAFEEMENGAEPPYDSAEQVLLRALDFSPEIVPLEEKPKTPRYFELRVYHSPTQRQLGYVHERFAGPEIRIFHRVGVHPIFYTDTLIGPQMPNLTYMIPFDSLAAREKAWDAFGADPEWAKVRQESIARGGQVVSHNSITLWRPAAYSPIQ
ncbi:MAG TPA: NIPSNAP family protein, partial [Bryobacteraceae bacterium]